MFKNVLLFLSVFLFVNANNEMYFSNWSSGWTTMTSISNYGCACNFCSRSQREILYLFSCFRLQFNLNEKYLTQLTKLNQKLNKLEQLMEGDDNNVLTRDELTLYYKCF